MRSISVAFECLLHGCNLYRPRCIRGDLTAVGGARNNAASYGSERKRILATLCRHQKIEGRLYLRLGELFQRYDTLICPTCGTRGLTAGDDFVGHGLKVGGRASESYIESLLTPVLNLFSRSPCLGRS